MSCVGAVGCMRRGAVRGCAGVGVGVAMGVSAGVRAEGALTRRWRYAKANGGGGCVDVWRYGYCCVWGYCCSPDVMAPANRVTARRHCAVSSAESAWQIPLKVRRSTSSSAWTVNMGSSFAVVESNSATALQKGTQSSGGCVGRLILRRLQRGIGVIIVEQGKWYHL